MTKTIARAAAKPATVSAPVAKVSKGAALISVHAFSEGVSRVALVEAITAFLGRNPAEAKLAAAREEYMAGRMASRLPAAEFPAAIVTPVDRIDHCRFLIAGGKATAGDKSEAMRKAQNAAKSAWSLVLAETPYGAAQTLKAKNAQQAGKSAQNGTPEPRPGGNEAQGKVSLSKTPVVPVTDVTDAAAAIAKAGASKEAQQAFIMDQARMLQMFANKHAASLPVAVGAAVRSFLSQLDKAVTK